MTMARKARDYFRGILVTHEDVWVPRVVGAVTRWFFDVLKNMLTAGVLLAMADKTGSPTLRVLAAVSTGLLGLFVLTPSQGWYLDILHPVKNELVRLAGIVVVRALIGTVAITLIYFEIRPAIEAVAEWNLK
jgi:hypothetical protein